MNDDTARAGEMDPKTLQRRQKSNKAVAKCIPPLLIAIVAYASWVFVGPLCGEEDRQEHHARGEQELR